MDDHRSTELGRSFIGFGAELLALRLLLWCSLLTRDRDQGDTEGGVLPLPLPRFISSFNSLEKLKNESRVLEMK